MTTAIACGRIPTRQVASLARTFAGRLHDAGAAAGSHVVIWSENRAEWIVALWGTILARAVLVPVDYRASADYLNRIAEKVSAHVVLVGQEVDRAGLSASLGVWHIADLAADSNTPDLKVDTHDLKGGPRPSDTAEIIFTSGATADPKGVVITHRNILANIVPIEREVLKYRKYARPFRPIRFLNLLPLSHMFGQSMATFVPPMLPGVVVFIHGYSPHEIVRQIKSRRVSVLVCVPKVLDVLREHVVRAAPEAADADALAGKHWARRWWRYRQRASPVRLEVLVHRRRRGAARSGARGVLAQARLRRHAGIRADGDRADRHAESSVPDVARHGRHADRRRRGQIAPGRRDPRPRRQRDVRATTTRRARRRARSRTAGSTPATSGRSIERDGC